MFSDYKNLVLKGKLNQGSFASLYSVYDPQSNSDLALKIESEHYNSDDLEHNSTILHESRILSHLNDINGIPRIFWKGVYENNMAFLMQLLGKDLKFYLDIVKTISLDSTFNLAIKLIEILSQVHNKGIIHRDLKPQNIMFGNNELKNEVFIVDFNLAKISKVTNKIQKTQDFEGNLQFASINTHLFIENSKKDDLESLGYLLLFAHQGELPWKDYYCENIFEKINKIGLLKQKFIIDLISKNSLKIPQCFIEYFTYVNKLKFNSSPDYNHLKNIFINQAKKKEINLKNVKWDWENWLNEDSETKINKKRAIYKTFKSSDDFSDFTENSNRIKQRVSMQTFEMYVNFFLFNLNFFLALSRTIKTNNTTIYKYVFIIYI